jgi:hypothetical protein
MLLIFRKGEWTGWRSEGRNGREQQEFNATGTARKERGVEASLRGIDPGVGCCCPGANTPQGAVPTLAMIPVFILPCYGVLRYYIHIIRNLKRIF